jgi:uncharacterized protein YjbI with pentapeptide repeats
VKLNRADVEWLLATHENGHGPIDWSDEHQRQREGLDLRGALLLKVDLHGLPLAHVKGGRWGSQSPPLWATVHGHDDYGSSVQLQKANLKGAQLQEAYLSSAQLEGANMQGAQLQGADLREAHLQEANLVKAGLQEAHLSGACLKEAELSLAQLQGAHLIGAQLQKARLIRTELQGADLLAAKLQEADLYGAQLQGANLGAAKLQEANLFGAQLQGAQFVETQFEKTQLGNSRFADKNGVGPCVADVIWGDTNLAVVDWSQVKILGDEYEAKRKKYTEKSGSERVGQRKTQKDQLMDYEVAVRANRQLAVVLQAQGLNEQAARFAYRAQLLQRRVFWFEMVQPKVKLRQRGQAIGAWFFSWFLYLLAGYGYKPLRSFLAYLFVIIGFAISYYLLGLHDVVGPHHVFGPYHLTWYEAIVVSMTAFHGRGFFANQFQPGDPQAFVAAFEAFVGLIIEVTLIATLTRRLFGQ